MHPASSAFFITDIILSSGFGSDFPGSSPKESFLRTFNNLLEQTTDVYNSVDIPGHGVNNASPSKGSFISAACSLNLFINYTPNLNLEDSPSEELLKKLQEGCTDSWTNETREILLREIKKKSSIFLSKCGGYIKPYLDHYESLLELLYKEKDLEEEEESLTRLIRSKLSPDELVVLYFVCLDESNKKLNYLIEKYSLLSNIDYRKLTSGDSESTFEQYLADIEHKGRLVDMFKSFYEHL